MIAFFDAFVDVREVGAEAGDGFEHGLSVRSGLGFGSGGLGARWGGGGGGEEVVYLNGPSRALMVSASRSSTACL